MNEYNKKMMKFNEFTEEYNDRLNELNDVKFIIREFEVELRKKNVRNLNTFLFFIEDDVIVFTFKKLFDSSIFIDDKNFILDD
jgi:hypothetical protein